MREQDKRYQRRQTPTTYCGVPLDYLKFYGMSKGCHHIWSGMGGPNTEEHYSGIVR